METQQKDTKTRSAFVIRSGLWIAAFGIALAVLMVLGQGSAGLGFLATLLGLVVAGIGWAWRVTHLLENRQA